jgi:hypothetical protein
MEDPWAYEGGANGVANGVRAHFDISACTLPREWGYGWHKIRKGEGAEKVSG